MARNFPNFIDAYLDYALDGFCPDSYHLWTCLSIISGAAERKVHLIADGIHYYPNIFVMLVGNPGTGKSTALKRGTILMEKIALDYDQTYKVFSGQMTQAGLITTMDIMSTFKDGDEDTVYSSGYYHASEASDSGLQNLHGDFNATLCAMYDCDDVYMKTLKKESYLIYNPSLSIIAGSTFDFLKTLVNQNSVMGGLASRFTYVIAKEKRAISSTWGDDTGARFRADPVKQKLLFEDLCAITRLKGQFRIERSAFQLYKPWHAKYNEEYLSLKSERMESITVRKPTLHKKILMLVSLAESDDLIITAEHMERSLAYVDEVTKDNARIISTALISNKVNQDALSQFILQSIKAAGGKLNIKYLKQKYLTYGGDISKYESTIKMLTEAGMVKLSAEQSASFIELLVEPDSYL